MSLASGTFHIIKSALFTSSWFVQVKYLWIELVFFFLSGISLQIVVTCSASPDVTHLCLFVPPPLSHPVPFACCPYVPSRYTQSSSFRSNLGEHKLFLSGVDNHRISFYFNLITQICSDLPTRVKSPVFFFLQTSNRPALFKSKWHVTGGECPRVCGCQYLCVWCGFSWCGSVVLRANVPQNLF